MPPSLKHSIIRYGSRVKWSNPQKGVAPSPTLRCSSYRKGRLGVTRDYGRQLYSIGLCHNCLSVSQCPGKPVFNPWSSNTKDSKMVLDAPLLKTQHYKVQIKSKVEQSTERSSALPTPFGLITLERHEPPYPPSCGLNSTTTGILKG